jgi:uncharacterized membrane protein YphA (DoxX/SURF4 family)
MVVKRVVEIALAVSLATLFLAVGATKFRSPGWETRFAAWGYPPWTLAAVAALEILGAVLLLVPRTRRWGCLTLLIVMAGAAVTHVVNGEAPRVIVNVILGGLLVVVLKTHDRARPTDARPADQSVR